MNEQQIKFIIEKINEGWDYEKISKSLNIDKRKINDLKSKGYTIINFTENEIYNEKEKVKSIIKNLMPFKIKE